MFIYCRSTANGGAITFIGSSSITEDRFYDEGSANVVQASDKFTTANHAYLYLDSTASYIMNQGCVFNSKTNTTNVGNILAENGDKTIKFYNCSYCESGCNSALHLKISSNNPEILYCNFISASSIKTASCFVVEENSQGSKYTVNHMVMMNNTQKGNGGIIECYNLNLYINDAVILGNPGNSYMFYINGGKIIISNSIVDYMTTSTVNGAFEKTNVSQSTPYGWKFRLLSPPYMRHTKICTYHIQFKFCAFLNYNMMLIFLFLD
ncbi:hypothetical protein TVAG_076980 [Trichomonas vaginalis G3]|uniref:Uncharacterized protein n=1 Tax=Trichomonas vaginalis (strain ATCC PRA-98 / G3) TaxID=412133 RepID=A2D9U5_TRIV3|nr:hypothetical protein TVAGG3_0291370 [Trichomonas vaginalis G3]EAY22951.1 hypothetical protein TVAG_076980 [Trichomonas vaginalis G3]KAI5527297.1 hypothetical protein TVAGG3_0291370 [Trichomonas vaginalis G3]|eukprot:XP_001583937.1 hypothetical protein [Trichomonas vaginalis G3]